MGSTVFVIFSEGMEGMELILMGVLGKEGMDVGVKVFTFFLLGFSIELDDLFSFPTKERKKKKKKLRYSNNVLNY